MTNFGSAKAHTETLDSPRSQTIISNSMIDPTDDILDWNRRSVTISELSAQHFQGMKT